MDEETKRELRNLSKEERTQRMEASLRLHRERYEQLRKEQERQQALGKLEPVLSAIRSRTGHEPVVLDDDRYIVEWIMSNFPFPELGSTCEWTLVPASMTIPTPTAELARVGLETLYGLCASRGRR